jgi:hypothetical protein
VPQRVAAAANRVEGHTGPIDHAVDELLRLGSIDEALKHILLQLAEERAVDQAR